MIRLPEITEHDCTGCGKRVRGSFGRWTCAGCGTNSPWSPPPAAYLATLENLPLLPLNHGLRPHPRCGEVRCVCPRYDQPTTLPVGAL